MKTKISALGLLTLLLFSFTELPKADHTQDLSKQESPNSEKTFHLNKKDLNAASLKGKNGYVLNQPGTYILSEDIDWTGCTPGSFAITINSRHVTLDGAGRYLKQVDTTVKHALAIQVSPALCDIHIQNIELNSFSGGGIWFRGGSSNLIVKNSKTVNCGYFGRSELDKGAFPPNTPTGITQGILFDGGHGKPINNAQVIDCTFVESGIIRNSLSANLPGKSESACGAILAYQASNIAIKGCTIDGCVGSDHSWGITLIGISNVQVTDVFITDVFSSKDAKGIYTHDVDGEIQDATQSSILSNIPSQQFGYYLDTHSSVKDPVAEDDAYVIEACHLKGIVPKHAQKEIALFNEHKWREFRTLSRLVCHNSHTKSRTSGIYATWVELFCERALGVKVQVVGGFANLYLHGDTPLPAHRDQYKKWVFGLSFGETRTLDFVPDNPKKEILSYPMESGDVFLFSPDVNNRYQHRMLAEPKREARRINVTYFLELLPGQDSKKLLHPPELQKDRIPTFEEAEILYNQTAKKE
jgi:hypothetical protein